MPVTELDIEAAALAIDAAAQDVAAAELMPSGPGTGAYWAGAQGRLRLAVAHHARLVEQRTAEEAAAEAFIVAEKAASKRLTAMSKEAATSRDKLDAAVITAQAALVALVDAIGERNAVVAGHAAELTELGLELPEEAAHENGATRRGAVQLRGQWWLPVDPAALLALVVERVKATRFDCHGGAEIVIRRAAKSLRLLSRADLGLDAVELPPAVPSKRIALRQGGEIVGAPVGISDWEREQERKNREIKYT